MIRLLLVGENRLLRMAGVLANQPGITVVGRAAGPEEALARIQNCTMILASARMSRDGALDLTRAVARDYPWVKILVISWNETKADILRYLEARAAGYVHAELGVEEMVGAIRAVHRGEALVSPEIAAALMTRLTQLASLARVTRDWPNDAADLTCREQEVLHLIRQDFSNRQIADHLRLEVGTVKNHVHNILAKLNVNSRQDAAACGVLHFNGGSRLLSGVQQRAS